MNRTPQIDPYSLWKKKNGSIGCIFARLMAAKPEAFGQRTHIVRATDPVHIAREAADIVTGCVADPQVLAATLVLPTVTDLPTLVLTAMALGQEPNWSLGLTALDGTPIGDVVAFRIVRTVPLIGGGECPSEALVLGPFEEFPNTRRAPLTALEIYVGEAPTEAPTGGPKLEPKANLADIPMNDLPSREVHRTIWQKTREERLRSLNGIDDQRAKAKVSFTIPRALASELRCNP